MSKPIWQLQQELEQARKEAEIAFLHKLINEVFQEGVTRGKFDAKQEDTSH